MKEYRVLDAYGHEYAVIQASSQKSAIKKFRESYLFFPELFRIGNTEFEAGERPGCYRCGGDKFVKDGETQSLGGRAYRLFQACSHCGLHREIVRDPDDKQLETVEHDPPMTSPKCPRCRASGENQVYPIPGSQKKPRAGEVKFELICGNCGNEFSQYF